MTIELYDDPEQDKTMAADIRTDDSDETTASRQMFRARC